MKAVVIGTGAIGRVFLRALAACDPIGVSRENEHLARSDTFDIAVVSVKCGGTAWAASVARRLLHRRGICVTTQNGLGNEGLLADELGAERAFQLLAYVGAEVRPDGSLFQTGPGEAVLIVPPTTPMWARDLTTRLAKCLSDGEMTVKIVEDGRRALWTKLVINAAVNPVSALFNLRSGEVLSHPVAAKLADQLARETARVARGLHVEISDDEAILGWRQVAEQTAGNRSSMLQDVIRGKPTEIRYLNGAVAAVAHTMGVATPLNEGMVSIIESIATAPRTTSVDRASEMNAAD